MKYKISVLLLVVMTAVLSAGCPSKDQARREQAKKQEKVWLKEFRLALSEGQEDFFSDRYLQEADPFALQEVYIKLSNAAGRKKLPKDFNYLVSQALSDYEDSWQLVLTEQLRRLQRVYSVVAVIPGISSYFKLIKLRGNSNGSSAVDRADQALKELQRLVERRSIYRSLKDPSWKDYVPNVSGDAAELSRKFIDAVMDLSDNVVAKLNHESVWYVSTVTLDVNEGQMKQLYPSFFISSGRDTSLKDPMATWSDLGMNYGAIFALLKKVSKKGRVTQTQVNTLKKYLDYETKSLKVLKEQTRAQLKLAGTLTSKEVIVD